jgi:AraC-like DNA-binding protein
MGVDMNLMVAKSVRASGQLDMGTFTLAALGLAGSGIGAALGLPWLWPGANRRDDTRLLGAGLLAASLVAVTISGRLVGILPDGAFVEHVINVAGLAAYPFLFLYLRRLTGQAASDWTPKLVWLPSSAYVLVFTVRSSFGDSTHVPFAWLLPVVLTYTAACTLVVVRRPSAGEKIPDALVPAVPLVISVVILNVAQVIRLSFGHSQPVRTIVPLVLTLEFVTLVSFVAWRARAAVTAVAAATTPTARYERSGLGDDAARALAIRIEAVLIERRLFADAGLTLARLAEACQCSPHQASESLNRIAGETFHEVLARHRLADVKRQLEDPACDAFSIEGIGQSAGFRSRSTLYAAFKRAEGMTPIEYRALHRQEVPGRLSSS